MSSIFEVPLTAQIQSFTCALAGVTYTLKLQWNNKTNTWQIDILDIGGTPLVSGIPMVANVDLLEQYAYLNFGGMLIAQTDSDPNLAPTFDNLGTLSHLYFVTPV